VSIEIDFVTEIRRNFPQAAEYTADSFLGRLHEEGVWNLDEYWKLEYAIWCAAAAHTAAELPREIAWPIFRLFSYFMLLTNAHESAQDLYTIDGIVDEMRLALSERFQMVVEGFFQGTNVNLGEWEPRNPMLS